MPTFTSRVVSGATYLWPRSVRSFRQWMNRLEFLWYVTEVLPAQLKMEWAGLLFLFKERPRCAPPLLPGDTLGRTSVGAPDLCPHRPTYSALPPTHPCSACFFPSTGVILEAQRSFCLGGELMRPDLEWRAGVTSSHGHQHRGHTRGFSLQRNQGGEILLRLVSLSKDTKTLAFLAVSSSCSAVDSVVFDWCWGGQQEEVVREEMPSSFCSKLIDLQRPVEGCLSV